MSCAKSQLVDLAESFDGCVLAPWEDHPRQLWSLFEMLHFSAAEFFWCGQALRAIRQDCYIGSMAVPRDEPIFALPRDLDTQATEKTLIKLRHIEGEFRGIGLALTAEMVKNIIVNLEDASSRPRNFQWLIDQITTIETLSAKELKGKLFLYIPAERAKFWPTMKEPNAFGEVVARSFPSTAFDIHNAAICIATTQSTAAVFHLMRILEIGLNALGKIFGVSLEHTNWAPAIEEIESKIRKMRTDPGWKAVPDCKEQQEFYAQAASHFAILKDAWRNYTMHARGKYTEGEAERIFENTKGFMQKLAERLAE
jgi:hypothetical protein